MVALILGLLVASATSAFTSEQKSVQDLATNLRLLDRALAHYGPEAKKARELLHRNVASLLDRLWPAHASRPPRFNASEVTAVGGALIDSIQGLSPHNDTQRWVHTEALTDCAELARNRWALSQGEDSTIPIPLLIGLVFWLAVLFTGFGLIAPRNATVIIVFFICALSVGGAIYLILDMDQPFDGLIRVASEPLQETLSQLGQ
jgi:hypothetical protein